MHEYIERVGVFLIVASVTLDCAPSVATTFSAAPDQGKDMAMTTFVPVSIGRRRPLDPFLNRRERTPLPYSRADAGKASAAATSAGQRKEIDKKGC
jgi:hypothetical protein